MGTLGLPKMEDINIEDVPDIEKIDPYSDILVKNEDMESKLQMMSDKNLCNKKNPKDRMKILNKVPVGKLLF